MSDSKQSIRGHIQAQIPQAKCQLIQDLRPAGAIRIAGDTPNGVLDAADYLASITPFVSKLRDCLSEYRSDEKSLFVAVKIIPGKHSYFVVDSNNVNYNYETCAPMPYSSPRLRPAPIEAGGFDPQS